MRHHFIRSLAGSRDPNFKNVTLLLHGDGTNGGQNNTFLDSGPNNLAVTMSGGVTQGTFSPYGDRWSNYFSASNQYLAYGSNAAFAFGTGDFTVECWYYPTTTSTTNQYAYVTDTVGGLCFGFENGAFVLGRRSQSPADLSYTYNVVPNQWLHLVAVRSGSTASLFLNGVRVATGTVTTNYSVTGPVQVGGFGFGYTTVGYLSNLRTVKGTAVYDPTQTTLTIPTAPLTAITNTSLLACQSNRFRDASTNNFTVTRNGDVSVQRFSPFSPDAEYRTDRIAGSGYFSSTFANYLLVNSATVNPAANPFTVESWVYYLGGSWKSWYAIAPGITYYIHNGNLSVWSPAGSNVLNVPVPTNAWTHIAVTRDLSNNLRAFVNGVLGGTVAISGAYNHTVPVIGERYGNGEPFFGYISGFRLLIGSAIYTSNFTVPTTPPAIINDTRWIVNFANSRIIDNAMMNNLQTVGNAQISTSIKKYGTGAVYFDGSGDWLAMASSENFNFGTGDFTIEAWVNIDSTVNPSRPDNLKTVTIFSTGSSSSNDCSFAIRGSTTAPGIGFEIYQFSPSPTLFVNADITPNTWVHIAFVRTGTTFYGFANGIRYTLGTSSVTISSSVSPKVGIANTTNYTNQFKGYIDDLRITKGFARYTSNFTPPTAPFPDF